VIERTMSMSIQLDIGRRSDDRSLFLSLLSCSEVPSKRSQMLMNTQIFKQAHGSASETCIVQAVGPRSIEMLRSGMQWSQKDGARCSRSQV
jgi:hypothetical protein